MDLFQGRDELRNKLATDINKQCLWERKLDLHASAYTGDSAVDFIILFVQLLRDFKHNKT
jgi:hypothetical protein